jgi:hypothetical protein
VTWDGFKGGSSEEQEEEKNMREGVGVFFFKRKIRRVGGT